MDKLHQSFLGTGWGFPPEFDSQHGSVGMLSDSDDIRSSLEILLSTRPGERVMLPDYGCNLNELLFEPLTTTMKTYMKDLIETAIRSEEHTSELQSLMRISTTVCCWKKQKH